MKKVILVVVSTVAAVTVAAETCQDHAHEHAQGPGVEVSAAAARAMGLRTVKAERRRMRSTVVLLGRLELAPDARWSAATPLGGRVALKVRPLQTVRAGEALFTVDAPELRAKAKEIAMLEQRIGVYRRLGRVSAELETQLAIRRAEREAMLAGTEETDGVITVRAAADGRVDALSVPDGAWTSPGATVVELVRPERVRFKAFVPASEAARIKDGMKALCGAEVGTVKVGVGDDSGLTPVYAFFGEGLSAARPGERLRVE